LGEFLSGYAIEFGGGRCADAQSGKDAILKLRALWEARG
jgi:hypothetical protein